MSNRLQCLSLGRKNHFHEVLPPVPGNCRLRLIETGVHRIDPIARLVHRAHLARRRWCSPMIHPITRVMSSSESSPQPPREHLQLQKGKRRRRPLPQELHGLQKDRLLPGRRGPLQTPITKPQIHPVLMTPFTFGANFPFDPTWSEM